MSAEKLCGRGFKVGDIVRQYHDSTRRRYDEAAITCVHGNGALDVLGENGIRYGWSEGHCEVVLPVAAEIGSGEPCYMLIQP